MYSDTEVKRQHNPASVSTVNRSITGSFQLDAVHELLVSSTRLDGELGAWRNVHACSITGMVATRKARWE